MAEFEDFSIFFNGPGGIEQMAASAEGLSILHDSRSPSNAFQVQGEEGLFEVWGVDFHYVEGVLFSDGRSIDTSKGAVVVGRDGEIHSAYILPLLAK